MEGKSFIHSKYIVTTVLKGNLRKCFKEKKILNSANPGVIIILKKATYLTLLMDKCGKTFKLLMVSPFSVHPETVCSMLNFDFPHPMKHWNDYSVGVLYLANLNLPRSIRFKWENRNGLGTD